jgi:beta-glucosidase
MGYENWPAALEATIRYANWRAQIPVIVTENGIATEVDSQRVAYLERALAGLWCCVRDGIELRGYFHWSLLDNFEWLFGYGPKFGLVAVDRKTQRRTVKESAEWLGRIARNNAI